MKDLKSVLIAIVAVMAVSAPFFFLGVVGILIDKQIAAYGPVTTATIYVGVVVFGVIVGAIIIWILRGRPK